MLFVGAQQDAPQGAKRTGGNSMEIGYFTMPSHPPECRLATAIEMRDAPHDL
jgi:hypothetical protein